jgi:hypothetical protein
MPQAARQSLEIIVAPSARGPAVQAAELRGSTLVNSIAILRERSREADYFAVLPGRHHEAMRAILAQDWVHMGLAVIHFEAMGKVFPATADQIANGRLSSERTQNGWIRTVARTLNGMGSLDVPTALRRVPMALERLVRGGGAVTVYRTGRKDALVEFEAIPILAVPYVRNAWQGILESALSMFTPRLYVHQEQGNGQKDAISLGISWV